MDGSAANGAALSVPLREKGVQLSLAQEGMPTPLYALQVPTQTKAIGVITPPPEIRAIVVRSLSTCHRHYFWRVAALLDLFMG